jgi:hypothetical protein
MAKKHTLKDLTKKAEPKAAYTMPAPNSDMSAYGWDLKNIRHIDPRSEDKKDPDAGVHIFSAPQENAKTMLRYGHDANFICPKYLQIILDSAPEIREATLAAAEARYTQEAIARIQAAVDKVFKERILPDIAKNFAAVSPFVAQFYAARLSHIKKFGSESGD